MWIGQPGALHKIRDPARGMAKVPLTGVAVQTALGGGSTVQRLYARERHEWQMSWNWLSSEEFAVLQELSRSPGGLVLIDPTDTNVLSPNQASGTDDAGDTTGFTVSAGTLTSSTAASYSGGRSLRWTMPPSPVGAPYVELGWYGGTRGIPVLANTSYAISGQLATNDTVLRLRLVLQWLDAAGSEISTSSWASMAPAGSLSTWGYYSHVATSPPTAAYCNPRLEATTPVASKLIHVDRMQLERAEVATGWAPGVSTPRVRITGLSRQVPVYGRQDVSMTLLEL